MKKDISPVSGDSLPGSADVDIETRPEQVLDPEQINRDWHALIELGPRFPGTSNNAQTVKYLINQLQSLPYRVWRHEFGYLGWGLEVPPTLSILHPERAQVDCQAFIYCGATPSGGLEGKLAYLGEHWVIGLLKWPKFAVLDDQDEICGYVSGRPDGPAIPQPLSERSSIVPHFIIGKNDLERLLEWERHGYEVRVRGEIQSKLDPQARMDNVIVSSLPEDAKEPRVALCAHLDSMYTCPGANDNAGGLSALLALARHYAVHKPLVPIDFIFFNGEEWDLAGSKAFVARYMRPQAPDVRYKLLLNLDGVSEVDDGLQFWVGPEGFAQDLKEAVDRFEWERGIKKVYKFPPPLGSDHVPFYNVGVPSCMITGYDVKKYHLPLDTYWEGGVDNICYVAELTRYLIDHFAAKALEYTTRESTLAVRPYYWSIFEG